jgi:hypothetical protein
VKLLLAIVALAAAAPDRDLLVLRDLDQRIADAGYRLARAATPFCAEQVPLSGFALHGIELYGAESRAAARQTFGLNDGLAVLVVAHGSAAEAAGLRPGDAILAVDGQAVPPAKAGQGATVRIETVTNTIERSTAPVLSVDIERNGARRNIAFRAERGCASRFWVDPSPRLDAASDGHEIEITAGYVMRAPDDAALAIVLAHELAHNILHHRARLDREGAHHGLGRYFGRSARLSRAAELEADRLSVSIIGCAGYSLDAALAFREDLWRDGVADALRAPDHPAARQRLDAIREAITRFRADTVRCAAPS